MKPGSGFAAGVFVVAGALVAGLCAASVFFAPRVLERYESDGSVIPGGVSVFLSIALAVRPYAWAGIPVAAAVAVVTVKVLAEGGDGDR
jgi:hypothetical protein